MPLSNKEKISGIELGAVIFLYVSADAMTAPIGAPAENQSWLSIVFATILAAGATWMYSHMSDSSSGKSIIEVGELLMGKWGGKIIGLLYGWFTFEICAYNLKNNWQMTATVALPNTPIIILAITAMLLALWMAYGGIETMSRLSVVLIPIFICFLGLAFLMLSKEFDFRNFLPITDINWRKVSYSSVQVMTFPLTFTVLFMMVFPSLNKQGKSKKYTLSAVLFAGLVILLSNIMYMLVLGPLAPKLTYPGYTSYSYIEVADFIDRAEILFYTIFIAINIVEIGLSLYFSALCLSKVFGLKNYRVLLVPLSLLALEYSLFIVQNHADHITIAMYVWPWYAIIYEIVIPITLFIIFLIRKRRKPEAN